MAESAENRKSIAVVVVDLYSASSRNASNALIVPLRRKKMSFQTQTEAVGTPSRVPEWDDAYVLGEAAVNDRSPTDTSLDEGTERSSEVDEVK